MAMADVLNMYIQDKTEQKTKEALTKTNIQLSQRNTLHPCAHELHMGCTTGELPVPEDLGDIISGVFV